MTEAGPALPREARRAHRSRSRQKIVTEQRQGLRRRRSRPTTTKNKKRFAQPERRDLLVVLTKTEAEGQQGQGRRSRAASAWKPRSPRSTRSTRPRSRRAASSRAWPRASRRSRSTAPIFGAKKGEVVGPVKTQFGYYVFKVTKITQGLAADARPGARHDPEHHPLPAGSRRRWTSSSRSSAKDYTKKTDCAKDYVIASARTLRSRRTAPPVPPVPPVPASGQPAGSLLALDEITRRLRRDCPWDREQDERSIVPHTVEEAYELADAANSGDDAKLLDELGDVLFQVYFLSLLLEERGQGDLAAVADHCRRKLIRRHPHVFGDAEADDAADACCATGTRSSATSGARRRGDLRRRAREPALDALRAQADAAGRVRVRLRAPRRGGRPGPPARTP